MNRRRGGTLTGALLVVALGCGDAGVDRPQPAGGTALPVDSIATLATADFDSLFAVADEIYFGGEYDSAAVLLRAIVRRATAEGVSSAEARALTWLSLAHYNLGDLDEAWRVGLEALELKRRYELENQLARSYNALGLVAWMQNRNTESISMFQQAIDVSRAMGDRKAEATASGNLALPLTERGRFNEVRSLLTDFRAAMAELGETRSEGNALTNLGMLEVRLGDPGAAIPLLELALARYREADYDRGTLAALGQLGTAYAALGEPSLAFAALDSALGFATTQQLPQEQSSLLEAMAELYRGAGDFQRALDLYDSAQAINEALGLDLETGVDLRGEADIYVRLGDMTKARTLAENAVAIHRRVDAPLEVLRDVLVLAEVAERQREDDVVERHLAAADSLADELGARIGRVEVGLAEARIADRRRRSQEVLDAVDRIRPDIVRGGYAAEWEARLLETRALERLGRYRDAAVVGRRALATVERVRGRFGSGVLRTAFVADKNEVYAQLVSVLLRLGEVREAFQVSDAARGRALREHTSGVTDPRRSSRETDDPLSDGEGLLRTIDGLVESIDALEETPPAERTPAENAELATRYQHLERARREYEGFLVQMEEADPSAAAFLGVVPPEVRELSAALAPGQLLVEYFVPPEGTAVIFVLSRHGVRVLESPVTAANLTSRVRLVRELIAHGDGSDRSDRVLAGLHDALIQPIIGAGLLSDATELVVVPHGALAYLPFAALRDRTTARFLIEDYALRTLPSAAALPHLVQRAAGRADSASSTVFAPFPTQLPATRREAMAIGGPLRWRRYLGPEATEGRLREALEGEGLVHVATHGVMNVRNPMFSRLELAPGSGGGSDDDGRLEVHELLGVTVRSPLVVLAGCETGTGAANFTSFAAGEDYATLAQAFLYAGATNVVATLWRVEDAGAAEFAQRFHRELDRHPPAVALARAQRDMRSHEEYSSPYYWAAYQIAGLDAPTTNGSGASVR